jgi:hypothetical protein
VKKLRFLPFWAVGLGVLVLYVAGLLLVLTVDRFVPALPNAAALGEASALVGSFLTVISIFFLLYTIHLQQKIRNEEAIETHWFELLKRWAEFAEDRTLRNQATVYEQKLVKVEISFRIPDSVEHLSEQQGLKKIVENLGHEGFYKLPSISENLDRLFLAMMTLRERVGDSGRDLLDNSFLAFLPQHVIEAVVYSALHRGDRNSLLHLTRLGLAERALPHAPKTRLFLTKHCGTAQQRKEKSASEAAREGRSSAECE